MTDREKHIFSASIKKYSAIDLAGLVVRTNMENAQRDCPQIWETFAPRIHEVLGQSADSFGGTTYGLSFTVASENDSHAFDYWAAAPILSGRSVPEGMATVTLPAGFYAVCEVPSLAYVEAAYGFFFSEWIPQQEEYMMNLAAPCFEEYDHRYLQTGEFRLCMPVAKK